MAPKKTYTVTLKLPLDVLRSVKAAPAASKAKSRVKKLSKEKKTGTLSPGSSPAPTDDSQGKGTVNTGPKELSTAGLAVSSIAQALDKSGRPCRRWTRAPIHFKTFSGFKISIDTWKQSLAQPASESEGQSVGMADGDAMSIKAEEAVTT